MKRNPLYTAIRRHALMSAGAFAVTAGGAVTAISLAQAAEINIADNPPSLTSSGTGFQSVVNPSTNLGNVSSDADGNTASDNDVNTGSGANPSTASVTGNLITAVATGNNTDAGIDLELINDASAPGANTSAEGIAVLTRSLNTGVITSSTDTNTLEVAQVDFTTGSLENVDNLISAQTTLNRGSTDVTGEVPSGYTPSNSGSSIAFDSSGGLAGPSQFNSDAVIATGSVQLNTTDASGSAATADDNNALLTVTPTTVSDGQDVTGSLALDDNSIQSQYTGNTATSEISVEAGGDPTFTGTAALSNIQANQGVSTTIDAQTSGNTVQATVGEAGGGGFSNILAGALTVSGNTISASATGNASLAGEGDIAGNQIVLADSLSFDGISTAAPGSDIDMSGGNVAGNVDADLGLFNMQANDDGDGITSEASGNSVGALAQNLDSGNITLAGNTVDARSRGNTASNAIAAGDSGRAELAGTAALSSAQVNNSSDTSASALGSTIEAQVGDSTSTGTSVITAGTVTLEDNAVVANAIGNQVGNSVALGAADLTLLQEGGDLGDSMAVLTGGDRDNGVADSTAGASLTNVQANFNSAVSATNSNTSLRIDAGDLANDADGVDASTLSILGGLGADIDAVAASASASNSLSLAGNQISGSAGLNNLQVLGETAGNNNVTAEVNGPSVEILADTDRGADAVGIDDSTLEIRDVGTRALAYATTAANTFDVDAGSGVTLANDNTGSATNASVVPVEIHTGTSLFFDVTGDPTVTANYGLLNNQIATADSISSTVTGSAAPYRIEVGDTATADGNVLSSTVEVENNALSALAFGNQSTNNMSLDIGNINLASSLPTSASGYAPIANVTNTQAIGDDVTVEANINTGGAGFEAVVAYDVTDSTVSVSDNTTQAQAFGNRASDGNNGAAIGNRLYVSGGDISIAPVGGEAIPSGISLSIGDGQNVADAAFSVQNAQSGANSVIAGLDSGGPVSANMGTSVAIGGDITNSSVLQDRNEFSATAVNNQAVNDLMFEDVTTLGASSGIANFQVVSSTTSSSTGVAGTEPTSAEDVDLTFTSGSSTFSIDTGNQVLSGSSSGDGIIDIDASGYSDAAKAYLVNNLDFQQVGTSDTYRLILTDAGGETFDYGALGYSDQDALNFIASGTPLSDTFSLPPTDGDPASKAILASIGGNSGSITDSTVSVSDNIDVATTRANDAVNRLNAEAVTLEPTRQPGVTGADAAVDPTTDDAVIAAADHSLGNYQLLRDGGDTDATAAMTLGIEIAASDLGSFADAVTTGSTLTVDDNSQQADAVGNNAVNRVDIAGTNGGDATLLAGGGITSALASFQQAEDGEDVNADSWMEAFAPASMRDGSSLSISGNETLATATVNNVDNASSLNVNTLAGSEGTAVQGGVTFAGTTALDYAASIADHALISQQEAGAGTMDVTSTLRIYNQELNGSGDIGIVDSDVAMSGNTAQATGRANDADNLLSLAANTLGATGALTNAQLSDTAVGSTATGNISLQMNAQDTDSDVSALQASTANLDGNQVLASSGGNRASNELALDASAGYGALTISAAIANLSSSGPQVTDAPFGLASYQGNTADIGADAEGSVLAEFASNEASVVNGSTVTVNENVFDASATANAVSNLMEERASAGGNASLAMTNGQINEGSVTSNAGISTTPLSLSIAATGDVAGTSDAIIVNSALSVLDNLMLATARGNDATNVMDAEVGPQTTANSSGAATASQVGGVESTSATYALLSGQQRNGTGEGITANSYGEVAVSAQDTNALVVDSSSVTLAGNIQQAVAVSNNVVNELLLSGTNSGVDGEQGVTSSLASWQEHTGSTVPVSATSSLSLSGPAQLTDSTLGITDNASVAMAVLNEASNMAEIDFTNLGSSSSGGATQATLNASNPVYGTADHLVSNIQLVPAGGDTTLSSSAILEALNQESGGGAFANGVDASNIGIVGNVAQAQSVANLASSTLNLTASGNMAATGGVFNNQENDQVTVRATAQGTLGVALDTTGTAVTTMNASSARIEDNRVSATAVSNQASNILNVTADAGYQNLSANGASASGANASNVQATATYAVLNNQTNGALVEASVNGSSANADFTGNTGSATVSGSSTSVSGNRFAANATGNSATNLMTASARPAGNASMALASSQVNTGSISATANSVNVGVNTGGVGAGIQGSTSRVSGNTISANATGNAVSSRITNNSRF